MASHEHSGKWQTVIREAKIRRFYAVLLVTLALLALLPGWGMWREVKGRQLIAAIKRSDVQAVTRLLAQGADMNTRDLPPLTLQSVVRRLLQGELPGKTQRRMTLHDVSPALLLAAQQDNQGIARQLIAAGAEVNVSDSGGETPLIAAAHNGNSTLTRLLLAHGANVNASNWQGETPMITVCGDKFGPPAGQEFFEVYDKDFIHTEDRRVAARFLLENGANVNAQTHSGYTPLRQAVEHEDVKLVKMLLVHHANIGCIGDTHYRGETLLDNVGVVGNVAPMCDLLIQAGAKSSHYP